MAEKDQPSRAKGTTAYAGTISFVGLEAGQEAPDLAVHVLDRSGEVVHTANVDRDGRFTIPRKTLEAGHRVVLASPELDPTSLDPDSVVRYSARSFGAMLAENVAIELGRRDWGRFLYTRSCVDGSVWRCYPYPWVIAELLVEASRFKAALVEDFALAKMPVALEERRAVRAAAIIPRRELANVSDAIIARPDVRRPFFRRCEVVCDGLVEVYRRTCCCHPWVIDDPRIPDLLDRLEELVPDIPDLKWPPPGPWPPGPGPDPPPDFLLFKGGAVDPIALRAEQDLHEIRALSGQAQLDYIVARPYLQALWCSCGEPAKVGQGAIRSDGTFHICWNEPLRFFHARCHDEYAFVVKQFYGGETIVIYDGLAANQWFDETSGVELRSYDRRARGCRDNTFPGTGAFALLQDIGVTPSYRLKTPDADGWDSVAVPVYNDGLLNPAPNPAAAKGLYKDQNLGGTLALRYHFSESMKGVGAVYYRVSVIAADANGDPTGPRTYLGQPLSWLYYEVVGPDIFVLAQSLGPTTVGAESNLFLIPYDADHDWQSGQYHAYLDTTQFATGRHLVTLEVFDAAGQRLRPNGSAGPGVDAAFTYRRWYQPIGPTADVPFAALTHMFWWDNRPAFARIYDLRKDGLASSAECQFLVGCDDSTFSAGYRAYHLDDMFILNHVMWWRRGLGGPSGTLVSSNDNAGKPPDPLAVTNPATGVPPATFANMLGPNTKCSFALNLHVNVKTTNGSAILDYLDAWDQAAFALETTGPCP